MYIPTWLIPFVAVLLWACYYYRYGYLELKRKAGKSDSAGLDAAPEVVVEVSFLGSAATYIKLRARQDKGAELVRTGQA
jgi:hypothetical protein